MRLLPYPKYKPSGIEWLGDVPEHWAVKAIKWESPVLRGASPRPIDNEIYFDDEGEYAWVRIADVSTAGMYLRDATQRLSELGQSLSVPLQPGALFLSIAGTVGKPCITAIKCCIHDGFVYFPYWRGDARFLYYLFASGEPYKGLGKLGTQLNLNTDTVGSVVVGVPTDREQYAISDFLDRETAKIDRLVAKKRALIDRLEEKRIALISRTVTRGLPPDPARAAGLNPFPKLKPSGIDWIGDVPEHWQVSQVSHQFRNLDHRRVPIAGEDRSGLEKLYPYYGASGIIDYVDEYLFDETLILVAEDGANLLSRSTPLAFLASGRYWVNNHAHILKPVDGDIRYWVSTLRAFDYTPLITGAAQPKLTNERLGSVRVPKPPSAEQVAIADFLDLETAKVDGMVSKVGVAIARLEEYRTALITAAVTGKVDVREAAAA